MPEYTIIQPDLEDAIFKLVKAVTRDAIEDEARAWLNIKLTDGEAVRCSGNSAPSTSQPSPYPMIHILHHANCADGFAAACIASRAFASVPHRVTPVNYPDPVQSPPDLGAGDQLIYVDYTPPDGELQRLTRAWGNTIDLLVIDHHKTAKPVHDELLHEKESVFDESRCGAALTWQHFFPAEPLPRMIELIQWRDLGHAFQPENADKPITGHAFSLHAYLFRCLPRTREAWTPLLFNQEPGTNNEERLTAALGTGGRMKITDQCIIAAAVNSPYWLDFHGEEIPAVNGLDAGLISDAMNALLKHYPTAPFAASWYVDPASGLVVYSLRSRKDGPDVGAIAKTFGGGGHPNAAGFHTRHPLPFV